MTYNSAAALSLASVAEPPATRPKRSGLGDPDGG